MMTRLLTIAFFSILSQTWVLLDNGNFTIQCYCFFVLNTSFVIIQHVLCASANTRLPNYDDHPIVKKNCLKVTILFSGMIICSTKAQNFFMFLSQCYFQPMFYAWLLDFHIVFYDEYFYIDDCRDRILRMRRRREEMRGSFVKIITIKKLIKLPIRSGSVDILECIICQLKYNDFEENRFPRIMKECGHSLCTECVNLLISKTTLRNIIQCPYCRRPSIANIKNISKNYALLDVIRESKE
ncbi:hypothetical protein GCK72_010795 [Caenorhabditis remanei]|uniref:RING-type domain-containing protein n=1 Tax=Caenorhabditis remanei TaxID=31234 RepID=A0A6A5H7P6_CAERE|nr:hypothetical protein GCK72_010795 [Caenorhabditis remanei]KAF1762533.1 hypothetical protein GCK72_010795 [Caenorhabditis remanei]